MKKSRNETYKPGMKAPRSGTYEIVGRRDSRTGVERVVTKGESFPPTKRTGQLYKLVDPVKPGRAKAATQIAIGKTRKRYSRAIKSLAKR